MSSTNLKYTKSQTTPNQRKADMKNRNKILGIILATMAAALAASVIIFRGGNY